MKKYVLPIMTFLLFFIRVTAQEKFEGKVVFDIYTDSTNSELVYYVSDNNIRMEIAGENSSILIINKTELILMMPEEKMYLQMPYEQYNQDEEVGEFDLEKFSEIEPKRTGEGKEILSYNCELWLFEDSAGVTEMWLCDDLGDISLFENLDKENFSMWRNKIPIENFFPLQIISRDTKGNIIEKLEAKELERGNIDPSLFVIPPDYEKYDVGRDSFE